MSPQDHALYRQLADEIDEAEDRKAIEQALLDRLRRQRAALLREKMIEGEE